MGLMIGKFERRGLSYGESGEAWMVDMEGSIRLRRCLSTRIEHKLDLGRSLGLAVSSHSDRANDPSHRKLTSYIIMLALPPVNPTPDHITKALDSFLLIKYTPSSPP